MKEIAERIKARREYKEIPQWKMAADLSMSRVNYTRIEGGHISVSAPDMSLIARALGVRVGYFYGDETDEDVEIDDFMRFYAERPHEEQLKISRSARAWYDDSRAGNEREAA